MALRENTKQRVHLNVDYVQPHCRVYKNTTNTTMTATRPKHARTAQKCLPLQELLPNIVTLMQNTCMNAKTATVALRLKVSLNPIGKFI